MSLPWVCQGSQPIKNYFNLSSFPTTSPFGASSSDDLHSGAFCSESIKTDHVEIKHLKSRWPLYLIPLFFFFEHPINSFLQDQSHFLKRHCELNILKNTEKTNTQISLPDNMKSMIETLLMVTVQ